MSSRFITLLTTVALLTTVVFLFPQTSEAQLIALDESFDSGAAFSKTDGTGAGVTFFSDGADSFFGISDGDGGDFGGDPEPTGNRWSPIDGGFLALEDLDGGMTLPLVLTWQGIDISNLSDLRVEAQIAAVSNSFGPADYFIVNVSIDGGPFETVADYRAGGFIDAFLFEDTDGDGIGDGSNLPPIFGGFSRSWSIQGTGSSLDLELRIRFDNPSETLAIDDLRVVGDRVLEWTAPAPGSFFDDTSWSLGFVPEATDLAVIRNGGSALADASAPGAPSPIETSQLVVGDQQGHGYFEAVGVDLGLSGRLAIGGVDFHNSTGTEDLDLMSSFAMQDAASLRVDDRAQIGVVAARGDATVATTTSALIENVTAIEAQDLDVGGPSAYGTGIASAVVDFELRGAEQVDIADDLWIAVGASGSSDGTAHHDVSCGFR